MNVGSNPVPKLCQSITQSHVFKRSGFNLEKPIGLFVLYLKIDFELFMRESFAF